MGPAIHASTRYIAVAVKNLIVDISQLDLSNIVADLETIRKHNRQRYEFEQLTAIVYEDDENDICVGYKDITKDEFWIRGHMPGMALMPGVMMCEAAAQLSSYYVQKREMLKAKVIGFGGLEDVHFRGAVVPGDRLYLLAKLIKVRPKRMLISRFQGVVGDSLVVEGMMKGVPLPDELLDSLKSE